MNTPTVERDEPTDIEARLRVLLRAQADEVIVAATPVLWPETITTNAPERPRRRLALVALAAVSAAALFTAVLVTVRPDADRTLPATTTPLVTDPAPDGPIGGPGEVVMVDNAYLELVAEGLPPGFVAVAEPPDPVWFDATIIVRRPFTCLVWKSVKAGATCSAVYGDAIRWYVNSERTLGIVVWVDHDATRPVKETPPASVRADDAGPDVRGHATSRDPREATVLSSDGSATLLPTLRWNEGPQKRVSVTLVGPIAALGAVADAEALAMLDTVALGLRARTQPDRLPALLVARYPGTGTLGGKPWLAMTGTARGPCLTHATIAAPDGSRCTLGPRVGDAAMSFEQVSGLDVPGPLFIGLVAPDVRKVSLLGAEDARIETATVAVPGYPDRFFIIGARAQVVADRLEALGTNGIRLASVAVAPFRQRGFAEGTVGSERWQLSGEGALLGTGVFSFCLTVEFPPRLPAPVTCWSTIDRPEFEARTVGDFVVGVVGAGIEDVTLDGVAIGVIDPVIEECVPSAVSTTCETNPIHALGFFVARRVDGAPLVVEGHRRLALVRTNAIPVDPEETVFNP